MSGNTTEWGDQSQVSSIQLIASNPNGTPFVLIPALQGPGQQPVVVPGAAIVSATAAQVPSPISITDQNGANMTDNAGNVLIIG